MTRYAALAHHALAARQCRHRSPAPRLYDHDANIEKHTTHAKHYASFLPYRLFNAYILDDRICAVTLFTSLTPKLIFHADFALLGFLMRMRVAMRKCHDDLLRR